MDGGHVTKQKSESSTTAIVFAIDTTLAKQDRAARREVEQELLADLGHKSAADLRRHVDKSGAMVLGIISEPMEGKRELLHIATYNKLSKHGIEALQEAVRNLGISESDGFRCTIVAPPNAVRQFEKAIRTWTRAETEKREVDPDGCVYAMRLRKPIRQTVRAWLDRSGASIFAIHDHFGHNPSDAEIVARTQTLTTIAPSADLWCEGIHIAARYTVLAPPPHPANPLSPRELPIVCLGISAELPRWQSWFQITLSGVAPLDVGKPDLDWMQIKNDDECPIEIEYITVALHTGKPLKIAEENEAIAAALRSAAFDEATVAKLITTGSRKPMRVGGVVWGHDSALLGACSFINEGLTQVKSLRAVMKSLLDESTATKNEADTAKRDLKNVVERLTSEKEAAIAIVEAARQREADRAKALDIELSAARLAAEEATRRAATLEARLGPDAVLASSPSVDALRAQIEHLRAQRESLTHIARQTRDERDQLRGELWRLQQAEAASKAGADAPVLSTSPLAPAATLLRLDELAPWCAQHLTGRVVLTKRALRSAAKSVYGDPELVGRCLLALDGWYAAMCFDSDQDARRAWREFLQQERLRDGRVGTAADSHLTWDTYHVTHRGRRLPLDHHLQGPSTRDATRQFRLYFAIDSDDAPGRIVVGHLPDHLPNRQT